MNNLEALQLQLPFIGSEFTATERRLDGITNFGSYLYHDLLALDY